MSGCGYGTAKVSGKVSYQGEVLKGGNVTFVSSEGRPSVSAAINTDGTYVLPKVPTGKVKICVETETLNPATKSEAPKYKPPPGQKAPGGLGSGNAAETGDRYRLIPKHYEKPETTDLLYEVKSGIHEHDINLKDSPAAGGAG